MYVVDSENITYKFNREWQNEEVYYVVGNTRDSSVWFNINETHEHIIDFEHNKCHDAADGLVCTVFGFLVSK